MQSENVQPEINEQKVMEEVFKYAKSLTFAEWTYDSESKRWYASLHEFELCLYEPKKHWATNQGQHCFLVRRIPSDTLCPAFNLQDTYVDALWAELEQKRYEEYCGGGSDDSRKRELKRLAQALSVLNQNA